MKKVVACLMILLLSGCATVNPYLFREKPNLISPARQLAEDYLESQKKGEAYGEVAKKYGSGIMEFYGLKEYRFVESRPDWETAALIYRIQSTNRMGGVTWATFCILFAYDEKLSSPLYEGLSISGMIKR